MGVVKGDMSDGDLRSLCFGQVVTWNQAGTQTLLVCPSGVNAVIVNIIARNGTGAQPLSFTVSVSPSAGNVTGSIALSGLTLGAVNSLAIMSATPTMLNGTSLIVTPALAASGSMTFDVLGYTFTSAL